MQSWKDKLRSLTEGSLDSIPKGDERMETYCEDTMMRAEPDLVVRARDEKDVRDTLEYCNGNDIPVTLCASQTSMTGASVAEGGVLVSTERLEGVVDIDEEKKTVTVKPGTITADLQKAVADAGWYFPVAPTSRDECRIGANVATNASGEDSYKYGPMRPYVKGLKIIRPDGSEEFLQRSPDEEVSWNPVRGGYETGWRNPIDLIIGSEGTLAFISEITLGMLPKASEFYTVMTPFASDRSALEFLIEQAISKDKSIRALEMIDRGALKAMKTAEGFPRIADEVRAFVYFKQEYNDSSSHERTLEKWYEKIVVHSGEGLAESILIAETTKQKEDFRLWRHRVPEYANELGREYWKNEGGKVGSDWWVPVDRLAEMMEFFYRQANESNLPNMAYAHLGRGHPHTNLLASNKQEHDLAHRVLLDCCRKAVELGGGVSGEHGLGKLHTDLLSIQHGGEVIDKMKKWKAEYDPKWILGRGNIFSEKDPGSKIQDPRES